MIRCRWEKIREALKSGPMSGPWYATRNADYPNAKARIDTRQGDNWGKFGELAMVCNSDTADYIAACDPGTVKALLEERDRLLSVLEGVMAIVNESRGVAGFHLNGAVAEWDEFEEISEAIEAVSFAKQGVTK